MKHILFQGVLALSAAGMGAAAIEAPDTHTATVLTSAGLITTLIGMVGYLLRKQMADISQGMKANAEILASSQQDTNEHRHQMVVRLGAQDAMLGRLEERMKGLDQRQAILADDFESIRVRMMDQFTPTDYGRRRRRDPEDKDKG